MANGLLGWQNVLLVRRRRGSGSHEFYFCSCYHLTRWGGGSHSSLGLSFCLCKIVRGNTSFPWKYFEFLRAEKAQANLQAGQHCCSLNISLFQCLLSNWHQHNKCNLSSKPPTVKHSPQTVNSHRMNSEFPSVGVRRGRSVLKLPHSLQGLMAPPRATAAPSHKQGQERIRIHHDSSQSSVPGKAENRTSMCMCRHTRDVYTV